MTQHPTSNPRTAMPQSWRPFSSVIPAEMGEAVIATDSSGPRGRVFDVYTYGTLVARRHSLADAKREVEQVYGPLDWRRVRPDPVVIDTYAWGPTDEFTEPTTLYVVEHLPKLAKRATKNDGYVEELVEYATAIREFFGALTSATLEAIETFNIAVTAALIGNRDLAIYQAERIRFMLVDEGASGPTDMTARRFLVRLSQTLVKLIADQPSARTPEKLLSDLRHAWDAALAGAERRIAKTASTITYEVVPVWPDPWADVVAKDGEDIVGRLSFHPRWGVLEKVMVDPAYRRKGIATRMAEVAMEHGDFTEWNLGSAEYSEEGAAWASTLGPKEVYPTWASPADFTSWMRKGGSSRPLYHGTFWPFSPGEELLPANQVPGGATYNDMGQAQDRVHLTHDIELAYFWAVIATGARGFGRPVVFEVTAEESYSQRIHDDHLGPIEEVLAPTATIVRDVTDQAYRAAEPHFDEWTDLLLDNLPVGRAAPFIKHLGKLNKTAMPARLPLPVDEGWYYRAHDKRRGTFSAEDASSRVFYDESPDGTPNYKGRALKGYSCYSNPHHLWLYLRSLRWWVTDRSSAEKYDIIMFQGELRDRLGHDGEMLVIPDESTAQTMSVEDFMQRLLNTPKGSPPNWPPAGQEEHLEYDFAGWEQPGDYGRWKHRSDPDVPRAWMTPDDLFVLNAKTASDVDEALTFASDWVDRHWRGNPEGACFAVSNEVERRYGWKAVVGVFFGDDDQDRAIEKEWVFEHYWNRLPDGSIFDGSAGQFAPSGPHAKVVTWTDPLYDRYVEWDDLSESMASVLDDIVQGSYASMMFRAKTAMPDRDGWWYHTGDGSPMDYNDPSKGWVHLGTFKAAEERRDIWRDRGLYRVRINPRNPVNNVHSPADDQDTNRINEWLGWGQPLDEAGEPYVPQDVRNNSYDHVRLDEAFANTGFDPKVHDAIYYENFMEDKGSVSVLVPVSAIAEVEFVNQQLLLPLGSKTASDYRGQHAPPEDAPPLHDLLEGDSWFPDDVYTHPQHYTHMSGGDPADRESIRVLQQMRGQPNAMVTIYRSLPPNVEPVINRGDWVAVSESYARRHGMDRGWDEWVEHPVSDEYPMGGVWERNEGDWPVVSAQVPAHTVRNGGNDIIEWGYWGPDIRNPRVGSKVAHATEDVLSSLEGFEAPARARDGDCLTYAPQVTDWLRNRGYRAETIQVWGWADLQANILAFLHQATQLDDGTVVDVTATQFDPTLPVPLVASPPEYLAFMEFPGIDEVTLGDRVAKTAAQAIEDWSAIPPFHRGPLTLRGWHVPKAAGSDLTPDARDALGRDTMLGPGFYFGPLDAVEVYGSARPVEVTFDNPKVMWSPGEDGWDIDSLDELEEVFGSLYDSGHDGIIVPVATIFGANEAQAVLRPGNESKVRFLDEHLSMVARSSHAEERVHERLEMAGFSREHIVKVFQVIQSMASRMVRDTAVRVLKLPEMVGQAWSDVSNGNEVWAIYRGGWVATVMLRRDTQPSTPEALRVDEVKFLQPQALQSILPAEMFVPASRVAARTYYHASDYEFGPGDVVLPQAETGVKNWAEQVGMDTSVMGPYYSDGHVYLGDRIDTIMPFGDSVYEVEPLGQVVEDPESMGQGWYRTESGARVVRKVVYKNRPLAALGAYNQHTLWPEKVYRGLELGWYDWEVLDDIVPSDPGHIERVITTGGWRGGLGEHWAKDFEVAKQFAIGKGLSGGFRHEPNDESSYVGIVIEGEVDGADVAEEGDEEWEDRRLNKGLIRGEGEANIASGTPMRVTRAWVFVREQDDTVELLHEVPLNIQSVASVDEMTLYRGLRLPVDEPTLQHIIEAIRTPVGQHWTSERQVAEELFAKDTVVHATSGRWFLPVVLEARVRSVERSWADSSDFGGGFPVEQEVHLRDDAPVDVVAIHYRLAEGEGRETTFGDMKYRPGPWQTHRVSLRMTAAAGDWHHAGEVCERCDEEALPTRPVREWSNGRILHQVCHAYERREERDRELGLVAKTAMGRPFPQYDSYLPEGLRAEIVDNTKPSGSKEYRGIIVRAVGDNSFWQGWLKVVYTEGGFNEGNYPPDSAVITEVWVDHEWRRKGVATGLLDIARDYLHPIPIVHNTSLSDDGRGWARSVGKTARYTPVSGAPLEGEWERDEHGSALRWLQDHQALVRDALWSWVGYPNEMRIHMDLERRDAPQSRSGSGKKMRAQAAALLYEVEHNARPTDKVLYRSDSRLPTGVTSWSERKAVAKRWDGDLYRLPRGAARGVRVADYINSQLDEDERQWLIDITGAPLEKVSRWSHQPLLFEMEPSYQSDGRRWWHASPSGVMGSGNDRAGVHVGTFEAAEQALNARIGTPVEGRWDGTRLYGETLLAGQATIRARGGYPTGYSASAPQEDHYPTGDAKFGDGQPVPPNARPAIFPVEIVGLMRNTPETPADDHEVNTEVARHGLKGVGVYYENIGEDAGSISAVVPSGHLRRLASKTAQADDPHVAELDEVSGDAWYEAANGETYWGTYGAAGLLVRYRPEDEEGETRFFLQRRAGWSDEGGTWSIPGGALERDEPPEQGAKREFAEETAVQASHFEVLGTYTYRPASDWTYTTVVAEADEAFDSQVTDEQAGFGWFTLEEMKRLPLHPSFRSTLPELAAYASLRPRDKVLV